VLCAGVGPSWGIHHVMAKYLTTGAGEGLKQAEAAAYARAVALEPTIRTSIVHTWFLQRDNKRVASTKLEDSPYIAALSLAEVQERSDRSVADSGREYQDANA
jgi:hypothetical protein